MRLLQTCCRDVPSWSFFSSLSRRTLLLGLWSAKDFGCFRRNICGLRLLNAKDSGCFRRDILRLARVIFLLLSAIMVCLIRRLSSTKDFGCFRRNICGLRLLNAKDSGCFRRDWWCLWAFFLLLLLLLLLWVLRSDWWLGLVLEANCEDWFSLGGGHDAEDCEKNSSHGFF